MRAIWRLIKRAGIKWYEHDCLTLGAALAYYTVFSLAPVLVIAIAVAGALFGQDAAQGEIVGQIRGLVGKDGATAIESLIESASQQGAGPRATLLGLLVLLLGSTSAFSQLQAALNKIWDAAPPARAGLWAMVRARVWSFAAVLGVGFLLSVSLVLSAVVAALGRLGWGWVPGMSGMLELADVVGSMIVHTLLFAMIFRLLPDAVIRWRDVWLGAAVTAGLFFVGKFAIGAYLASSELGVAYGAASWLILILAWVYYSAEIVLFGAEFTRAYALWRNPPGSAGGTAARGMAPPVTSPRSRPRPA